MIDINSLFAVCNLEGKDINGWHVKTKLPKPDPSKNETGGNFSICYIVEKDGLECFMKVLDIRICNTGPLPKNMTRPEYIEKCTREFNYERSLSSYCDDKRIKSVICYIEGGDAVFSEFAFSDVPYIIYEKAEGDIRKVLNLSKKIVFAEQLKNISQKLKSLHDITVGMQQLHNNDISHQDMKPSNVLSVNNQSKIGDLGRSLCLSSEIRCPYPFDFNGDLHYAPPEAFFKFGTPKNRIDLYQMDNYMLGSLVVFYISGLSFNTIMSHYLPTPIRTMASSGISYEDALPYLTNAYSEALIEFEKDIPIDDIRKDLTQIVEYLCNPDMSKRGHPKNLRISTLTPSYDLIRTYTTLDKLVKKAERGLYKK